MFDKDVISYEQGSHDAWLAILNLALQNLGYESPEKNAAAWVAERKSCIQSLRTLCDEFGDNKWNEINCLNG
jgi:hypothetical protein